MSKPTSDRRATERKHPWPMVRLGDVLETGAGGTPLKQHRDYYDGGDIPWLRSGEVCKRDITETELFITAKGMKNSSVRLFPRDSVVVAMYGATAGQVGILRIESTTNQAVCAIFPSSKHVPEFLYYQLLGMKEEMVSQAQGGAQPNISQIKIKNLQISLPPLPVQREIVARLERELAAVETMKKGFEALAETAKAEFKAELKEVFEELKHRGTETRRLGDVCETGAGGTPLKQHRDYYDGGDIPWLRSGEVCKKDITETEVFITVKGMENSSAKLFPRDSVVVAMYGATAGQVGILRIESTTNQAICAIFPSSKHFPEFLYYQLLGMKEEMVSQAQGGAQPNISQIKIKNLQVCLPPLPVQREVVVRLDLAKACAEKLEAKAREGVAICETMRKAILKEAFE